MSDSYQIAYKKRMVAFLDVMGFKELLSPADEKVKHLQNFYSEALFALKYLTDKEFKQGEKIDFQTIFVSDAIVLSVEISGDAESYLLIATRFFERVAFLQTVLALYTNVWIRGAVTIGDLHIDAQKNILVGPAFVNAYSLESIADYARVIVDPGVCKHFGLMPHEFVKKINENMPNLLIEPGTIARFGGDMWMNDAIMVDWFSSAISEKMNCDSFFENLRTRMLISQSILKKSLKLLGYFRESLSRMSTNEIYKDKLSEYFSNLDSKLKEFGI